MLELSNKFAAATTEAQKNLLAAGGEAMLARGAHGSPGVFPGFLLPTIASFMISWVMLKGRVFGKVTAYVGIFGSLFLLSYLILVTFVPGIKDMVMMLAMPGGILTIVWMILFSIRLFQLGRIEKS